MGTRGSGLIAIKQSEHSSYASNALRVDIWNADAKASMASTNNLTCIFPEDTSVSTPAQQCVTSSTGIESVEPYSYGNQSMRSEIVLHAPAMRSVKREMGSIATALKSTLLTTATNLHVTTAEIIAIVGTLTRSERSTLVTTSWYGAGVMDIAIS